MIIEAFCRFWSVICDYTCLKLLHIPIYLRNFAPDIMIHTDFRIRQYGRTELALCYFPTLTGESAWRKLRGWIRYNHALFDALHTLGYDGCSRSFTPLQVEAIVHYIGEP